MAGNCSRNTETLIIIYFFGCKLFPYTCLRCVFRQEKPQKVPRERSGRSGGSNQAASVSALGSGLRLTTGTKSAAARMLGLRRVAKLRRKPGSVEAFTVGAADRFDNDELFSAPLGAPDSVKTA